MNRNWRDTLPVWKRCEISEGTGVEVFVHPAGVEPTNGPLVTYVRARAAGPIEGELTRYVRAKRLERSAEFRAAYDDLRERENSYPKTPEHVLEELRAKVARIEESL